MINVGDVFVSSAIINPAAQYESRITCVEINEKGVKLRREHPMYNGAEIFIKHEEWDKTHWVKIENKKVSS